MTACVNTKQKCLFCKHSRVGDPCANGNNSFTKASLRDILDKAIIYKVKIQYLNEQLEKAKTKHEDEKASPEVKKMKKSLKESIKIKELLDNELELLKQADINNDSMFNIETITIKEIIQN